MSILNFICNLSMLEKNPINRYDIYQVEKKLKEILKEGENDKFLNFKEDDNGLLRIIILSTKAYSINY